MASRLQLQTALEAILGSRNVYFQPPSSVKMKYPAIVYELGDIRPTYADDGAYLFKRQYKLTVIDSNPDSSLPDAVLQMPYCRFDRNYKSDNLNHTAYTLYY